MTDTGDFYEDDEPIEDIIAAFDGGEKGVTEPAPELHFVQASTNTGLGCIEIPLAIGFPIARWVTHDGEQANTGNRFVDA